METYIIVPKDLEKAKKLDVVCRQLFFMMKDKVFIYCGFNEQCMAVAREIAIGLEHDFNIDPLLNTENGTREFPKKNYWPNYFIKILVVQSHIAGTLARIIDPDIQTGETCNTIPTDTLFRLKDIFPKEDREDGTD